MLGSALNADSERLEGPVVFCENKFQQDALFRVILRTLVIGVKDEVAERIENSFSAGCSAAGAGGINDLVIHRYVRMMADDKIGAHPQKRKIPVSCVRRRERCKFFAAVGDNDAPSAFFLYFINVFLNPLFIVPEKASGLVFTRRLAAAPIADAENADSAGFIEKEGTRGVFNIHAGTDGPRSGLLCAGECCRYPLRSGIHNVVVAEIPDVRTHFLKHTDRPGIYGVQELSGSLSGRIRFLIDDRAFYVCDHMISAVKKAQHIPREKSGVLPLSVHISVKSNVSRENK